MGCIDGDATGRQHLGAPAVAALPWRAVASNPSTETVLTTLAGAQRSLSDWLTTFHLASVVLDPYTNESAWVLPSATRILEALRGSDVRVNLVVTCDADGARAFLGSLAEQFLVFCDPDRSFVRALGLGSLPAFVFVRVDGTVAAAAEGWDPAAWRGVAEVIAEATAWIAPAIPAAGDPGPFHGTPALG
jgi:hypothetical protein